MRVLRRWATSVPRLFPGLTRVREEVPSEDSAPSNRAPRSWSRSTCSLVRGHVHDAVVFLVSSLGVGLPSDSVLTFCHPFPHCYLVPRLLRTMTILEPQGSGPLSLDVPVELRCAILKSLPGPPSLTDDERVRRSRPSQLFLR